MGKKKDDSGRKPRKLPSSGRDELFLPEWQMQGPAPVRVGPPAKRVDK